MVSWAGLLTPACPPEEQHARSAAASSMTSHLQRTINWPSAVPGTHSRRRNGPKSLRTLAGSAALPGPENTGRISNGPGGKLGSRALRARAPPARSLCDELLNWKDMLSARGRRRAQRAGGAHHPPWPRKGLVPPRRQKAGLATPLFSPGGPPWILFDSWAGHGNPPKSTEAPGDRSVTIPTPWQMAGGGDRHGIVTDRSPWGDRSVPRVSHSPPPAICQGGGNGTDRSPGAPVDLGRFRTFCKKSSRIQGAPGGPISLGNRALGDPKF